MSEPPASKPVAAAAEPETGRLIAIGDIHGCAEALETLLEAVAPTASDIVVTVGDYVDRGPDVRGVLERLLMLATQCQLKPIKGNHEEMLLDVVERGRDPETWIRSGAAATLDAYGCTGDWSVFPAEHIAFLRNCLDYYECSEHFFTHANYVADLPLNRQPADVLRWRSLQTLLPAPHQSRKQAIVGHTAHRDGLPRDFGHLLSIDTYCYGGGWLSAVDLTSDTIWQARPGELREVSRTGLSARL